MKPPVAIRALSIGVPLLAMCLFGMGIGAILGEHSVSQIAGFAALPLVLLAVLNISLRRSWKRRERARLVEVPGRESSGMKDRVSAS